MGSNKMWTQADIFFLQKYILEGMRIHDVASVMNRSDSAIRTKCRVNNIEIPFQPSLDIAKMLAIDWAAQEVAVKPGRLWNQLPPATEIPYRNANS